MIFSQATGRGDAPRSSSYKFKGRKNGEGRKT